MAKLLLHVGHGKTGSSFIQSVLSQNHEKLINEGILYPRHTDDDKAKKGQVTSGNGLILLNSPLEFFGLNNILLSSESLFKYVQDANFCREKLKDQFDEVTIILYTRNVMDFLISAWGQHVKRNGVRLSLTEYLEQEYIQNNCENSHHLGILNIIKNSKDFGFKLIIRNYSNHRSNLIYDFTSVVIDVFGKSLNLDTKNMIVNRSLTRIENQLIRYVNHIHPKLGRLASDTLVNMLPKIKPSIPPIPRYMFDRLEKMHQPILHKVNKYIDKKEIIYFGEEKNFIFLVNKVK